MARKGRPTVTPSTVQHFTPKDCCLRPGRFSYQIVSSCCWQLGWETNWKDPKMEEKKCCNIARIVDPVKSRNVRLFLFLKKHKSIQLKVFSFSFFPNKTSRFVCYYPYKFTLHTVHTRFKCSILKYTQYI